MNKVYLADFNYFNGYIQRNWNHNLEYTKRKRIRRKQKQGYNKLVKSTELGTRLEYKEACTVKLLACLK